MIKKFVATLFFLLVAVLVFVPTAMATNPDDTPQGVSASVTAENQWTSGKWVHDHGTVVLSGTFSATVSLQRSGDRGTTWKDTGDTWTSAGVYTFTDYTDGYYRVGVATGNYTSGTAVLWLGSE